MLPSRSYTKTSEHGLPPVLPETITWYEFSARTDWAVQQVAMITATINRMVLDLIAFLTF